MEGLDGMDLVIWGMAALLLGAGVLLSVVAKKTKTKTDDKIAGKLQRAGRWCLSLLRRNKSQ